MIFTKIYAILYTSINSLLKGISVMEFNFETLPALIDAGIWDAGHIQGIALDTKKEYIYYSFTTLLVKAEVATGKVVGYVDGLTGHLGCIDYNDEDGKLYGSIEYKHDSIGKDIAERLGVTLAAENAFYIAIFDVDKIDRLNMDAEKDGIMKTVYLPEVVADYEGTGEDGKPHHYACSGVDGTAFGPAFGTGKDGRSILAVACGIYGDLERSDNDYQVIRAYDWRKFDAVAQPLIQGEPHHSGVTCEEKYHLFTGNTTWGVQNLEYDAYTGDWFITVYKGKKPCYPNFPMFVIDGEKVPYEEDLRGVVPAERAKVLTLKKVGITDETSGVSGFTFPYGATGIHALGNGVFYFSIPKKVPINAGTKNLRAAKIKLYRFTGEAPEGFEAVEPV